MKNSSLFSLQGRRGFTLIELLVVIAVIAILAGLLVPVNNIIGKTRRIKMATAELEQMQTAIEAFKRTHGTYPPDAATPHLNQLFFELKGTIRKGTPGNIEYETLDGSGRISELDAQTTFGPRVKGFVNSSASAKATDESSAAKNYLTQYKPNQSGAPDRTKVDIKVVACSVRIDEAAAAPFLASEPPGLNPWRYVSTAPTNNPNSYDLWVDLRIGTKNYRISNWSKSPQVF